MEPLEAEAVEAVEAAADLLRGAKRSGKHVGYELEV